MAENLQPQEQETMQGWADRLRAWGLHQFAAALLEAGGPLNVVGAQLVYLGQPVFRGLVGGGKLNTLAHLLEEPDKTQTFIQFLREEAA